ncbi:MAG: carbohydrate ABC transporter permease [Firmicutes bacterium]|nr:carbohydrate ABC transporter permease [Bacillota bacterium]
MKRSKGEKIFDIFNYILLGILGFCTLYPFLNVLTISLSTPADISRAGLRILPLNPDFYGYRKILQNSYLLTGYKNTIIRTVLGTAVNVVLSAMVAYPLSKKYLPQRNLWTSIIVFTMFFSGGLIPSYLLVQKLKLTNTIWALILPGAINTFNMIIIRNYFMSLPVELEESARIDGANDIRILFSIILPVSAPIIATVTLWYAVGHWNAWFDALIYITNEKLMVLQVILRKMVVEGSMQYMETSGTEFVSEHEFQPTPDVIKAATIMVSSIPIIMVYPFVQKYFIQGIMIGSLKG